MNLLFVRLQTVCRSTAAGLLEVVAGFLYTEPRGLIQDQVNVVESMTMTVYWASIWGVV